MNHPSGIATHAHPLRTPDSADRSAQTDVIVIGAGVAGLAFALTVPSAIRVTLLTKGALGESNTRWAQGGLSAAIGADDTIELHESDTLYAGAGLSDPDAVRRIGRRRTRGGRLATLPRHGVRPRRGDG